ncbi:MAG: asparagine synthase (glutamine-hydrolyzing), partial [Acidobacteriota bacterium]
NKGDRNRNRQVKRRRLSGVANGIALGVRRLAVIDLVTGDQPFFDETRSTVAVLNGEIYNFRELRTDLEKRGHKFFSRTDTEVLPHLYEEYGVKMVEKLNGMFAFAVWDSVCRRLFIARDRLGQKPLYYGKFNNQLIFGSEIKALLSHPNVRTSLDIEALREYLVFDCVPAPRSIYEGISKLPAGHSLVVENGEVRIESHWTLNHHKRSPIPSIDEAAEELRWLLDDATRMRLVSDVPLGVLLSGGIDSSTIAAFAEMHSAQSIKTFCIGFEESGFDESSSARHVAEFLGTDHSEECLSAEHCANLLPEIAGWLDEPMSDPSMVPMFFLSRFVRSEVTVALGGDGADELFGGYPSYYAGKLIERYLKLPHFIRKNVIENFIKGLPTPREDIGLSFIAKRFVRALEITDPLARHFSYFGSFSPDEQESLFAPALRSQTYSDVCHPARNLSNLCHFDTTTDTDNMVEIMQFLDMKVYLAEDILTKVDRSSMAVSLEVRSPFLDSRIAEFAAALPRNYKLKCDTMKFAFGKTGKYVLKKAMEPILPASVVNRMKRGFVIPTGSWIKGAMNPLVRELLAPDRIKKQALFDPQYVERLLTEHETSTANHAKKLWSLLVFQLWTENWGTANQRTSLSTGTNF